MPAEYDHRSVREGRTCGAESTPGLDRLPGQQDRFRIGGLFEIGTRVDPQVGLEHGQFFPPDFLGGPGPVRIPRPASRPVPADRRFRLRTADSRPSSSSRCARSPAKPGRCAQAGRSAAARPRAGRAAPRPPAGRQARPVPAPECPAACSRRPLRPTAVVATGIASTVPRGPCRSGTQPIDLRRDAPPRSPARRRRGEARVMQQITRGEVVGRVQDHVRGGDQRVRIGGRQGFRRSPSARSPVEAAATARPPPRPSTGRHRRRRRAPGAVDWKPRPRRRRRRSRRATPPPPGTATPRNPARRRRRPARGPTPRRAWPAGPTSGNCRWRR